MPIDSKSLLLPLKDKMRPRRATAAAAIGKSKMFKKPSRAQMALLWDELSKPSSEIITTSPSNNNLTPNNQILLREHFLDLYRRKELSGVTSFPVEVYIQFICEYVNKIHRRNREGQIPVCAVKEGSFYKGLVKAFLYGQHDGEAFSEQLSHEGLDPFSFLQVRHLFLLDRSITGHMALIVISPQSRTVEIFGKSPSSPKSK